MLTDKEAVVLDLMQTEDLLGIGNWEEIIKSLVAKGYARRIGELHYRSTPAGQEAFETFQDAELLKVMAGRAVRDEGPVIEGEIMDGEE
jgi:hypothetical protein